MTTVLGAPSRRRPLAAVLALTTVLSGMVLVAGAVTAPARAAEYYPVPASGSFSLDGRGHGHGHGMSQYGSQGAASQGIGAADILSFYYPGTVQTAIGNPTLRVQLTATASGDIRLDTTSGLGMTVRDAATGASASGPTGAYRVVTSGNAQTVYRHDGASWVPFPLGGSGSHSGPIEFSTADGVTVTERGGNARNYRGSITVVRTATATSVAVNHVRMDDYLRGVVPRESPAWFRPAALQAQSVAARSYAWWDVQTPSSSAWDICDTTACQVYGGRELFTPARGWEKLEYAATSDAVASTSSIALYYGGKPAFTQFSASNGGWASPGSQPYLAAFADPYDGIPTQNTNHRWTATLSAAYLEATHPAIGTLTGLRITGRDGRGEWGGRITSVELVGTNSTVRLSSARFNLKSTWWRPLGAANPIGDINTVEAAGGAARIQGWTLDPDSSESLAVHAYVDGAWGGAFTADVPRPDVGAAYPGKGDRHGFDIRLSLSQGRRNVCLYAINVGAGNDNTSLGCRRIDVGWLPVGDLNSVTVTQGQARLQGWALDQDTPDPIAVHVYVNGAWAGQTTANLTRADVGTAYPAAGPDHGFDVTVPLAAGENTVCVYGIDSVAGSTNPELGCRRVTVAVDPIGDLNRVAGGAATVDLSGWALDPDTPDPIDVHVYVDGAWGGAVRADAVRDDVARAYPGTGNRHGFSASLPVAPGAHEVCVYAINVGLGSVNTRLGCGRVLVGRPPIGDINGVSVAGLVGRVSGWAIDPDTSAPIDVHLYVDGRWGGAVTADASRPDVGRAYPASGDNHGFVAPVPLRPGANQICAYAINVAGGGTNPLLGCRLVTLPATAADPFGNVDGVKVSSGRITVAGWLMDPDVPLTPIDAHVYVDGRWAAAVTAGGERRDVGGAYPGFGSNHGFSVELQSAPGRHTVCVYGINRGQGTTNPLIGCRTVDV